MYCISIVMMVIFNDDGVIGRRLEDGQVLAMQCNTLTIYYFAYVCSCKCYVANKFTLTLTLDIGCQSKCHGLPLFYYLYNYIL